MNNFIKLFLYLSVLIIALLKMFYILNAGYWFYNNSGKIENIIDGSKEIVCILNQ
jgi:hypothetical protein